MGQSALNNFNKGMTSDLGRTVPQLSTYLEGRNIRIIANEDSAESGVVVNVDGNEFSFDLEGSCPALSDCYVAWEAQASTWQGYEGSFPVETNIYFYNLSDGNIYFYTGEVGVGQFFSDRYDLCGPMPSAIEIAAAGGDCTYDAIGWTTIRDTLYIFATNNFSANPGGVDTEVIADPDSHGVIFEIEFDLETNEESSTTIVYEHPSLNFTKQSQIEAIGRYESKKVQRLYWTDNFNTVRTINVKDPNVMTLLPTDLDVNPLVSFSTPEVVGVISSGELPAGMYQYAYRLKSSSGSETRFSPFTNFLHVVKASEGGAPYWEYSADPEETSEYSGSTPGEMCSKSIRLRINNLDLDYDVIEVAAIYKTTKEGVSSSYIFARQTISSETTEVVHSSNTSIIGLISLVELTTFNYNIRKAKTIETKDNRLFLGNVITPTQEFSFNATALRYTREDEETFITHTAPTNVVKTYIDEGFDPEAAYTADETLYAAEATASGFLNTLTENLDAVNPYNTLRAINNAAIGYKYQKDGVTLGGEGANVSYKFIKKVINGDVHVGGSPATSPPFVDVVAEESSCTTSTEWVDYKNPVMTEGYKGYQRDEVYRFGIVLHDLQGNPGFVNWVGDIRFPAYNDFDIDRGANLHNFTLSQTRSKLQEGQGIDYSSTGSHSGASIHSYADGTVNSYLDVGATSLSELGASLGKELDVDTHEMYALGIQFTVIIPHSLKLLTSGYSVVRVERKEGDKTVLGVGMGSWMYRFADKSTGSVGDNMQVAHSAYMNTWQYDDNDTVGNATDHGQLRNTMMNMDSPDFVLTGKYPTAGECDWIQVVGSLSTGRSRNAWENDFKFEGADTGTDDDFYRKMYSHAVHSPQKAKTDGTLVSMFMDNTAHQSGDADGTFFKPMTARKFSSGGTISGDNNFPNGINNIGIEVNGTTSQDTYSIGCDTLYLEFKGDTSEGGGWNGASALDHGVKTTFPYWVQWMQETLGWEGIGAPDEPTLYNQIYFNDNADYDDDVEYFAGSDPLDTSLSGSEDDTDDRHNNPWGRFKSQEKPLLAWRRERLTQYGGATLEARSRSIYMSTGKFTPIDAFGEPQALDVWGGDMFIHFYDFQKMRRWQKGQSPDDFFVNDTSGPTKSHSYSFVIPVESTINIGLRTGYHFANKDNFSGKESEGMQLDQYQYDQLYSAEADLKEFYPKAFNYVEADEFDTRVLYSELKTNGDKVDSWRQFKLNNYRDVDGAFGPINKLVYFADTIYYFQDRGVGVFSINPVAITTTTDQSSIVLGTGAVIQNNKYLSTGVGCKHQWSVLSTNKGLYWVDILTNSVYKINSEGTLELSRVKGLKNYFEDILEGNSLSSFPTGDNPVYHSGITTGFDSKNNEVLFSFIRRAIVDPEGHDQALVIQEAETLVYSETTGTFTSFYDFASPFLINTQDKLLSVHPDTPHDVFLHNTGPYGSWYGIAYDSVLKFIVNQFPVETKVFDNLFWYMDGAPWSYIASETSFQGLTGGDVIEEVDMWQREGTWRAPIGRVKDANTRLRDKTITHTFKFDNIRETKFRLYYIETKFRISKR